MTTRHERARHRVAVLLGTASVLALVACGDDGNAGQPNGVSAAFAERWFPPPPPSTLVDDSAAASSTPASTAPTGQTPATTTADGSPGSAAPGSTIAAAPTTGAPTTTVDPLSVRHGYPIGADIGTSYTPEGHANYTATDLFATTDCGTPILATVDGVVDEVIVDSYDRDEDDPAKRGGNAVALLGDDGVRYYFAHFSEFAPGLAAGNRVAVGDELGLMGDTGRAGACHLHFGLSLPCPGDVDDWWIRRGVIWPDEYLDAWQAGENRSPLAELQAWFAEYPNACNSVDDTPYPRA